MMNSDSQVRAAYAECRRVARRHYENFPVASYLVPRAQRGALAAIYAFSRQADDLADEPGVEGRLRALAEWRQKLTDCYAGRAGHPIFIALREASARFDLSEQHFQDLLRAFEQDVVMNRHRDFSSLLTYCRYSANPVGRLVLELFGHRHPDLVTLSDYISTALQLTNFWQDVAVDLERDRVYLPLEDLERFHLSIDDLSTFMPSGGCPPDERWQGLMAFEVSRTKDLFEKGKSLAEKVAPELRRQLRLTWLGGKTILEKIESARYDVFHRRPTLGRWDFLRLYLKARRAPPLLPKESAPAMASHHP